MPGENKTLAEFQQELKDLLKFDGNTFLEAAERMSTYANEINKTFGQGRQRMQELMTTITDAIPGVNRLGGTIVDVSNTIKDVAEASRRNVVANAKDVENLYAATKLLGTDAETLTNAFLDIGVGIEQIPKQLNDALSYVRSIGGNSKQVFESVQRNMDMMNRYQFEGGVAGLTKMAAQASMLRFSMNETFRLADKVLSPEGAVETAAAFQRLGVAAGNLVDPFQLMNLSINDPSGLQDSLADVAKQFTYFDEKTKSFKINPQGVLTLRELESQTGVNAAEMSKLGLAAAELDKRLSQISPSIKFENEEDKQFLSNIAKMGEDGQYEVQIKDDKGQFETKKLSEITQAEFDKLIKEQKEGPQTLEEAARAQLTVTEIIKNDLSAIRNKIVGGVVSAGQITKGMEDARRFVEKNTKELASDQTMTTADARKQTEQFIGSVENLLKDLKDPNKKAIDAFQSFFSQFGKQLDGMKEKVTNGVSDAITRANEKKKTETATTKTTRVSDKVYSLAEGKNAVEGNTTVSSTISSPNTSAVQNAASTQTTNANGTTSKVSVEGGITVKIDLPPNFNQLTVENQSKILDEVFNSQKFQQMLVNSTTPKSPTKAPVQTGFS